MVERGGLDLSPFDEAGVLFRENIYGQQPNFNPVDLESALNEMQALYLDEHLTGGKTIDSIDLFSKLAAFATEAAQMAERRQDQENAEGIKRLQLRYESLVEGYKAVDQEDTKLKLKLPSNMSQAKGNTSAQTPEQTTSKRKPKKS